MAQFAVCSRRPISDWRSESTVCPDAAKIPPSINSRVVGLKAFSRFIFPSAASRLGMAEFCAFTFVSQSSSAAVRTGHPHPVRYSGSSFLPCFLPRGPSLQEIHFSRPNYVQSRQWPSKRNKLPTNMVQKEGLHDPHAYFGTTQPFLGVIPGLLQHLF